MLVNKLPASLCTLIGIACLVMPLNFQEVGTLQRTLAMVKPDAVLANYSAAIKAIVQSSGFRIVAERVVQLNTTGAKVFYAEHYGKDFFPDLLVFMTSGPIVVMVLEKERAVEDWRSLIGPTDPIKAKREQPHSIRAMYGLDTQKNCVHGSDSLESAAREIAFFFETDQTEKSYLTMHDEL
eukprot:c24277_g1_i1 orf=312-854(-)